MSAAITGDASSIQQGMRIAFIFEMESVNAPKVHQVFITGRFMQLDNLQMI